MQKRPGHRRPRSTVPRTARHPSGSTHAPRTSPRGTRTPFRRARSASRHGSRTTTSSFWTSRCATAIDLLPTAPDGKATSRSLLFLRPFLRAMMMTKADKGLCLRTGNPDIAQARREVNDVTAHGLGRPDPYAVLGVAPTASAEQITSAYRARVRALHPDTHPDRTDQTDQPAQRGRPERLDEVMTAYATLRDARRRAEYDGQRAAPPPRGTVLPVRQSGRSPYATVQGFAQDPVQDPVPVQVAYVVVIGPRPRPAPYRHDPWLQAGPVRIGFRR
ncbi:J domain-containing protein [Streptomyces sp. NPDC006339]|uniref:J domain-containing protein n=1 Tax=Streptomyces sp. NPDC006339 TaxID=3156755 RepID=UPI0033BEAF56